MYIKPRNLMFVGMGAYAASFATIPWQGGLAVLLMIVSLAIVIAGMIMNTNRVFGRLERINDARFRRLAAERRVLEETRERELGDASTDRHPF